MLVMIIILTYTPSSPLSNRILTTAAALAYAGQQDFNNAISECDKGLSLNSADMTLKSIKRDALKQLGTSLPPFLSYCHYCFDLLYF